MATVIQNWQGGTGYISVKTFGAIGDGVTDDTAAIQAAIDSVNAVTGGTVVFPPATYLITSRITVNHDNIVLQGMGYRNAKIKCGAAGAGLTIAKPGDAIMYAVGLRDLTIDGDTIATTGLIITNLSEAILDNVSVMKCTTGMTTSGVLSSIWDFSRLTISFCTTGIAWRGAVAHCVLTAANFYALTTVMDFSGFLCNKLSIRDSWFEDFDTVFFGAHSDVIACSVRNLTVDTSYFLSTRGVTGNTTRIFKAGGTGNVGGSTWRGVRFTRNTFVLSFAKYLFEVGWGVSYSIANRVELSLVENFLLIGTNTTSWFTTDVDFPPIQLLRANGNMDEGPAGYLVPSTIILTDVPNYVLLMREGMMVYPTASLPAAGAGNDGTVVIEDGGAGNRNLVVYAGSQRFRIDGGAAF